MLGVVAGVVDPWRGRLRPVWVAGASGVPCGRLPGKERDGRRPGAARVTGRARGRALQGGGASVRHAAGKPARWSRPGAVACPAPSWVAAAGRWWRGGAAPGVVRGPDGRSWREGPRPAPGPAPSPPRASRRAHVTARAQTSRSADPARLRRHPGYKRATSSGSSDWAAAAMPPFSLLLLALCLRAAPAAALVR